MTDISDSASTNAHYVAPVEACPWCASPRKAPGLAAFECGVTSTTVKPSVVRPSLAAPVVRVSAQTPICRTVMELRAVVEAAEIVDDYGIPFSCDDGAHLAAADNFWEVLQAYRKANDR